MLYMLLCIYAFICFICFLCIIRFTAYIYIAFMHPLHMKIKVGVIGTGNWGTTVALMVANNLKKKENLKYFVEDVLLWGVEEYYEGKLLSNIINEEKCNKKYLKEILLPSNLICISEIDKFKDVNVVIVALPHQYINTMESFKGIIKDNSILLSVTKGFIANSDGSITLISGYLKNLLKGRINVLMGANIANEVAKGGLSEGTLGYEDEESRDILYKLINSPSYRVTSVRDIPGVELLGSLKNIVSLGCGIITGLGYSGNTKAAFIRNGLMEMKKFLKYFYPESKGETILESCGVADLSVSCSEGRNYKFGIAKGQTGISEEEYENEMGGQKIQGTGTAEAIYKFLEYKGRTKDFPLFCKVYGIFFDNLESLELLNCISPDSLKN